MQWLQTSSTPIKAEWDFSDKPIHPLELREERKNGEATRMRETADDFLHRRGKKQVYLESRKRVETTRGQRDRCRPGLQVSRSTPMRAK
jgi:hypothetical protein